MNKIRKWKSIHNAYSRNHTVDIYQKHQDALIHTLFSMPIKNAKPAPEFAPAFYVSKKTKHYLATKHLLNYLYCHQNTFTQLGPSTKPSFEKVERIPREMNTSSLAQLAIHPHGFSTGTKDRPGRLILRDILDHEIPQFKRILITPENHS
jgi:hypothetical protein